jgi:hypothetical protein
MFHDLLVLRDFLGIGEQIMSHLEGLSYPSEMEFLGGLKSGARTHRTPKAGRVKFGTTDIFLRKPLEMPQPARRVRAFLASLLGGQAGCFGTGRIH